MNSFDFNFHCLEFWRLVSPFDTNECRTMVAFIATTMVIIAKVTHCWDHGTWTSGASLSLLLILLPASLAIWHIPWDDLMRFYMGFFHTPNVSCPNQPPELLLMATYMSASWACMPNSLLCFLSPIKICLPVLTTVLLLSLDGVTWQPKFSFQAHTLAHLTQSSHNLYTTSMYLSHAGFPSWNLSCLNNLIAAKGLSRHTLPVKTLHSPSLRHSAVTYM